MCRYRFRLRLPLPLRLPHCPTVHPILAAEIELRGKNDVEEIRERIDRLSISGPSFSRKNKRE